MDSVVRDALEVAARRDWETLRLKLHPYVRWKLASGNTLNGRKAVLAMLAESPPPRQPAAYELRDDQIYRWTAPAEKTRPGRSDPNQQPPSPGSGL
jgi:hypothetical protein